MKSIIEKIQLHNGVQATFTLKHNAMNIFLEPQNDLWSFDLEGHLIGMYVNGRNYRRTFHNKFYMKNRIIKDSETFRQVEKISIEKIIPILENGFSLIRNNLGKLPAVFQNPLQRILQMDLPYLENKAKIFSKIYLPISILPPDQYLSLVIQITEGCNYNQCTFCNFYRNRPFKIKSQSELNRHLVQIKNFFDRRISLRKSIFLADANAIAVPQNQLIQSLKSIQKEFPRFNSFYSFIDIFTGLKKSVNDFRKLKELGLKRGYLGIESGNSELMLFLNKKQYNADIIELTSNLKLAGINVGLIFLIGAGGKFFAKQHQTDSIELLKKLPLSKNDIVYLSELNETNREYIKSMHNRNYKLPTKLETRQWSHAFKSAAKQNIPNDVKISIYDVNQFFY